MQITSDVRSENQSVELRSHSIPWICRPPPPSAPANRKSVKTSLNEKVPPVSHSLTSHGGRHDENQQGDCRAAHILGQAGVHLRVTSFGLCELGSIDGMAIDRILFPRLKVKWRQLAPPETAGSRLVASATHGAAVSPSVTRERTSGGGDVRGIRATTTERKEAPIRDAGHGGRLNAGEVWPSAGILFWKCIKRDSASLRMEIPIRKCEAVISWTVFCVRHAVSCCRTSILRTMLVCQREGRKPGGECPGFLKAC